MSLDQREVIPPFTSSMKKQDQGPPLTAFFLVTPRQVEKVLGTHLMPKLGFQPLMALGRFSDRSLTVAEAGNENCQKKGDACVKQFHRHLGALNGSGSLLILPLKSQRV